MKILKERKRKGTLGQQNSNQKVLGEDFSKKEKYVFLFAADIENSSIPTFGYRRDNYIFMIT